MAGKDPALRGRQDEIQALAETLHGIARGLGRVVLLEGEAGIGKTRLLDELQAQADRDGVIVYRGAAEELEQGRPFGSLVDALGAPDAVPGGAGGRAGGRGDARFLAQDAFVDHVERLAAAGPVLLAVDDLHWADRASLATLWALARRTADLGLLLVLMFRPTPQSRELDRIIEGGRGIDALHLRLGPIADDAVVALAADVVGAPPGPALLEELRGARGNPFVAIELLRAYADEDGLVDADGARELRGSALPPPLRDSLLRRLTVLGDQARRALSVAAVLGGGGQLEDLAALLEITDTDAGLAVAEATKAGLLEPVGDQLAFRHDLIREALYQDLPEPVRSAWHRDAARRLEGRADPAVVARHLALGATRGDADVVAGLARSASELVGREPEAAAELLERALEISSDMAVRPELGAARAAALLAAGRAEEAAAQAAEVLADRLATDSQLARAHVTRGNAAFHLGRPVEAVEGFGAALATGALDEIASAHALAHEASNRMWTFELDAALERAEQALADGERLGITAVQVEALATRCGLLGFRAEASAAIDAGRLAVELAGDDPTALRRTPHTFLALALLAADRLDEAREVAEEGRRRSTEHGQVLVLRSYYLSLARIAFFSGRWDDAVAEADTNARLADDFGVRFGLMALDALKGMVAFHRGDAATARALVERHDAPVRRGPEDASGSELMVLLRAELLEADGRLDDAAGALLEYFEVERTLGMNTARLWPGPTCVRLAVAAGRDGDARAATVELETIAERADTATARGVASFARGVVDGDTARLRDSVTAFGTAGRPFDTMTALEALGAVSAADQRDEAVAALRDALRIAEDLGAVHDSRRVASALRALGARSSTKAKRRRATEGWESLTDAEQAVAGLVGDGLRNAEIAERLFISRRTVESHLSRLYTKLAVSTRVALANEIKAAGAA